MSIYVTLPSNGGGKEFGPTNQNSEYKIRLPERLKLLDEEWEVALASISLPTFDAVRRSILHKFPETTKVGFKSGLLAYEEKDQPADTSTNPTQLKVVYGVVTISDVLNGVVPFKEGFSFARNLVIQLHTKLNLARMTEIRRLQGTGKSVYNPRWRDPNGNKAYEQTIVFGLAWTKSSSMVIFNTRASLRPSTKSWWWPWGSSKPKAMRHRDLRHWWRSRITITRNLTRGPDALN